ncbi:MAG: SDR family oxidoreductase [Beijerinckiaceae bacterium]|jgi:dTDP-4-dehydrorhamnose reductase|nr:SDR family oxidoreductase [Beijerinckiaceae bacterium]
MTAFIFGLGHSSLEFIRLHGASYGPLAGTVRGPHKAARIAADGLVAPMLFGPDMRDDAIAPALAEARYVLVSIPPGETGDPVLKAFGREIAVAPRLERIVYLSTIGVYGDHAGAWIDETTTPRPTARRSQLRLDAEKAWRDCADARGCALDILRLAGIYGPGRNQLASLAAGTAKRLIKPGQVFNRIHVTDIAHAIHACFIGGKPGAIYNVTDDEPAPPQDVVTFAAGLLGIPPPPEQDFATAELTSMARSFYGENKRVSNARLKRDLALALTFPTYREGLRALLAEGEGRAPAG